ncbi:MAG: DUF3365 domain-containing protein [Xanthomonadales bacterium]|jgi:hypothetical protein|nr:DUF3365 domain-containing protein [Xanthomonadales bacterium]
MKRQIWIATLLLAGLASTGWTESTAADATDSTGPVSPAAEQGQAILAPFKQQLMGALMAGMAQGPDQAIDVCRLQAPAIAADLSDERISVGRTSHRLRNPENAGPAWATAQLQAYLEQGRDWQPQVVQLDDGRTGYVEPIVTQPLCLVCHGSELAPAVQDALETHYPEDRATGFATGDLRGVFWVSFDAGD